MWFCALALSFILTCAISSFEYMHDNKMRTLVLICSSNEICFMCSRDKENICFEAKWTQNSLLRQNGFGASRGMGKYTKRSTQKHFSFYVLIWIYSCCCCFFLEKSFEFYTWTDTLSLLVCICSYHIAWLTLLSRKC